MAKRETLIFERLPLDLSSSAIRTTPVPKTRACLVRFQRYIRDAADDMDERGYCRGTSHGQGSRMEERVFTAGP